MINATMHHLGYTIKVAAKLLIPGLCFALMVAATQPESEQGLDKGKATRVKAAYLYNFTKYITWPEDAFEKKDSPIVIGILGKDPFGSILDETVKGKHVGGRSVRIRRLKRDQDGKLPESEIEKAHLLFISDSMKEDVATILEIAHEADVMTVSDLEKFASDGGMIGLVLDKSRIVFEVNLEVVNETHLKMSSKLLKLARIVKTPPGRKPPRNSARVDDPENMHSPRAATLERGRERP